MAVAQGTSAASIAFGSRTGTVANGEGGGSQSAPVYLSFTGDESGTTSGGTNVNNAHQSAALALTTTGQSGTGGDTAPQGDALQWQDHSDGTEIVPMESIGTIDGVRITFLNGVNKPGNGRLVWDATDSTLAWRAPGTNTAGDPVTIDGDGSYVLQGVDQSAFIRATVDESRLPTASLEKTVLVQDRYNVAAVPDVSAADASAGVTKTWQIRYANTRGDDLDFVIWIDASESGTDGDVEFSDDNVTWYNSKSHAEAVADYGLITSPATSYRILYMRRTFAAATDAAAAKRVVLRARYSLNGSDRENGVRGLYRIANDAQYRFYRKSGSAPVAGVDTVWATASSLPNTPTDTFADGTWYVGVTYFNGYAESGFLRMWRFVVSSGSQVDAPPAAPVATELIPEAAGVTRVRAIATREVDAKNQPNEWAIWYTTDKSTPGSGAPDVTTTLTFISGVAILDYALPAQADGATVKTLVKTRHSASTTYSENSDVVTATAAVAGKGDMIHGDFYSGRPGNPGTS